MYQDFNNINMNVALIQDNTENKYAKEEYEDHKEEGNNNLVTKKTIQY